MKPRSHVVLLLLVAFAIALVIPLPLDQKVHGSNPEYFEWGTLGGDLPQRGWRYNATIFGSVYYGDDDGLNFFRLAIPGPLGFLGEYGPLEIDFIPTLVIEYSGELGTGFYITNNKLLGQFVFSCTHLGWTTDFGWFTTEPWHTGPCFER